MPLRRTLVGLIRTQPYDLTARQLAVLLICKADTEMLTAGVIAERLGRGLAAISVALDQFVSLRSGRAH